MSVQTLAAVPRALSCHNCRQWALRSSIASIGGVPIVQQPSVQRRAITHTGRRRIEARERLQQGEGHALNEINDIGRLAKQHRSEQQEQPSEGEIALEAASRAEAQAGISEEPGQQDSSIPWYLQIGQQTTQQTESPMAARQRIPELPDHPPDILQPLVRHVSVELGMDDLSLLDLRTLDPPPALGSNLFMLIGTARSEKHLHVSADKLCRWLRTEYHIHPIADGLLGRNELKLKMRRRAKRTKLMSAVGAQRTADTEIEEGIRTGWVCVNMGRVEGGELPEQKAEREAREQQVVGFGASQAGCNIVVQMMTEEKRGEIDLEKLWSGILRRSTKEKEAALEQEERDEERWSDESTLSSELEGPHIASNVASVQREAGIAAG